MVRFMIFKYLIAEAVPFLSDPIFQDIARQLAGSIGFQELISWPEAEFAMVPDAGHSFSKPRICSALISATKQLRDKLMVP